MGRITTQKRQKEMKRQERQRAKAERRAQKKLEKRAGVVEEVPTNESIPGAPLTEELNKDR